MLEESSGIVGNRRELFSRKQLTTPTDGRIVAVIGNGGARERLEGTEGLLDNRRVTARLIAAHGGALRRTLKQLADSMQRGERGR